MVLGNVRSVFDLDPFIPLYKYRFRLPQWGLLLITLYPDHFYVQHYEDLPIQHTEIFFSCKQMKIWNVFLFCSKHRLWVHVRRRF